MKTGIAIFAGETADEGPMGAHEIINSLPGIKIHRFVIVGGARRKYQFCGSSVTLVACGRAVLSYGDSRIKCVEGDMILLSPGQAIEAINLDDDESLFLISTEAS